MYALLLCWRYLRTRYLAFVCIVSVMLGVATLIVVNSVMSGFSTKLRDRLHGILADVVVESIDLHGFPDPQGKIDRIRNSPAGTYVAAVAPTIEVVGMMQYQFHGSTITRPVRIIGVDPDSKAALGGFAEHLKGVRGEQLPSTFELPAPTLRHYEMRHPLPPPVVPSPAENLPLDVPPPPTPWEQPVRKPRGAIIGQMLVAYRPKLPGAPAGSEAPWQYLVEPGDPITITTVSGAKLAPAFDQFAVAGYFHSGMSENDSSDVYVPLDHLQRLRAMDDRVTHLHVRLTDYKHAPAFLDEMKRLFPGSLFRVQTWEEKQGAVLAAIGVERAILNVLLFMIVGVAGFGILAIFSMIVVEKTRDIGILKALGASRGGVASIFLGFGMLLGVVGGLVGTGTGLLIVHYLNEIEVFLSFLTGQQVFPRDVYYFDKIPTNVEAGMLAFVNAGTLMVTVLFSVGPALRASALRPVQALRFE